MKKALATALVLALACGHDSTPPSDTLPGAGSNISFPTGCKETVNTSSGLGAGTQVLSLGPHTVGDVLDFTMPAGTVSFEIVEQAVSAPISVTLPSIGTIENTAVPLQVNAGTSPFYNDIAALPSSGDLTGLDLVFLSSSPGTGTLTFPNTSAGLSLVASPGLSSGPWSLVVSDFAYECATHAELQCAATGSRSSTYDVTVITKSAAGGIPPTGNLDVEFYFATRTGAGGTELTEANVPTDTDLARMVSTFKTIVQNGTGLTVGTVHFNDLPDSVVTAYATGVNADEGGPCADIPQLLKNANPGNKLNIFFVSAFRSTQGRIVGVDGTIPGPSSFGGTVASGAVVQVSDLRGNPQLCTGAPHYLTAVDDGCGADDVAYFVAHEAGHFLGLYHTSEKAGLDFDTLTGTPECPCSTCANLKLGEVCSANPPAGKTTHEMTFAECAGSTAKPNCGGGDNLMFWLFDAGATPGIVTEQAQVMRANPLIQ